MQSNPKRRAVLHRATAVIFAFMGISGAVSCYLAIDEARYASALLHGFVAVASLVVAPFHVLEARKLLREPEDASS